MMKVLRSAVAVLLGLLAGCIVSAASAADASATLPTAIQTFFKQHCYECHGSYTQESGLRYDGIVRYRTEDSHLWTMVHQKLSTGEMPPKDSPRPTAAENETVLKWIETQQQAMATSSLRRLNRRELAAALRDLTVSPSTTRKACPAMVRSRASIPAPMASTMPPIASRRS